MSKKKTPKGEKWTYKKTVRTAKITLDKPRLFRFDMRAIAGIEQDTGKPFARVLAEAYFGEWITLIYYGLKWEDNKLTREHIEDMLDVTQLEGILDIASQCFKKPEAEDEESEDEDPNG